MDKTLLRHRIRRHPLYRSGEAELVRLSEDPKLQRRLTNQWLSFCVWLVVQEGDAPESWARITRNHVIRYGKFLKSEFDSGKWMSTASAASNVSGMNTVMRLMNRDWETVSAVQDCGIQPFSHIPSETPTLDKTGLPDTQSLAGYLLDLQKTLGLVIREALILDLKKALRKGLQSGWIFVISEQTGVRRQVPCRPAAIQALAQGISARRLQKQLPSPWAFDDFLNAHKRLAARQGFSTDSARGVYVCDRYRELTGVEAPRVSGRNQTEHWHAIAQHANKTLSEAKGLDKNVRRQIARELGVLGIEPLKPARVIGFGMKSTNTLKRLSRACAGF